jgi:hypothetical protein
MRMSKGALLLILILSVPVILRPVFAKTPSEAQRDTRSRTRTSKDPGVPRRLKYLLKRLKSRSPGRREAAMNELARCGKAGRAPLIRHLRKRKKQKMGEILRFFQARHRTIRSKVLRIIKIRRRKAQELITDRNRYPSEGHGRKGQPEVDRAVGLLRRAYENPFEEVLQGNSRLRRLQSELQAVCSDMERYLGWNGVSSGSDSVKREVAERVNRFLRIRYASANSRDARMLSRSLKVLQENERTSTSMSPAELNCVRLTNEYRMMFGLPALKVDDRLARAARKHSDEMKRLGYFSHTSPVPAHATPKKRCEREGARFSGENIARGYRSGQSVFEGWYRSSDHHRNMLAEHETIGVGRSGQFWTQNFGKKKR